MGQEFCNGCEPKYKIKEEFNNFSYKKNNCFKCYPDENKQSEEKSFNLLIKNKNILTYKNQSFMNSLLTQRKLNDNNNDYTNKNTFSMKMAYINTEENINKKKIEEINKIKYNYKLKLIYNFFIKIKKAKEESHKEIVVQKFKSKNKNKNKNLNNNNNNILDTDINLFPIEEYEYIGNKFKIFKDGFGIQHFYDIDKEIYSKYIGYFRNDYRIKYCKYIDYNNNYNYEGEIYFNETGKYGILRDNIKDIIYEGEWRNNQREGYGIEIYKNETIYKGEFHNNKKNGIGFLQWEDGSTYEGTFSNNYMNGEGIYYFKEGSYYSGMWEKGEMSGFGVYCFPKKEVYIGYHKKDEKNGFGIINWFNKNKIFVGFWKNSKQNGHGVFLLYGKVRYGLWEEGLKNKKYENFEEFKMNLNDEEKQFINIYKMEYNELLEYVHKFINNEKCF